MRPYQDPIGMAERWRRYRRTRWSCSEDIVHVFAAASKHELVGVAAAVAAELRASGGSRGNGNWTGELVDRRVGGFMSWPAVPGRPRCMTA